MFICYFWGLRGDYEISDSLDPQEGSRGEGGGFLSGRISSELKVLSAAVCGGGVGRPFFWGATGDAPRGRPMVGRAAWFGAIRRGRAR